jgi:hypothetical protein
MTYDNHVLYCTNCELQLLQGNTVEVEVLVATGQSHKTGTAAALCASQGVCMKVGTKVLHSKVGTTSPATSIVGWDGPCISSPGVQITAPT